MHWELALGINPLHPEGWFALGFCCLKSHDNPRAVQALTRCTQQQPDNGEAWNNIAAVHLQARCPALTQAKPLVDRLLLSDRSCTFQDGRFEEAHSALQEAVKYKRDSWQTWSNLAAAAVKTQNYQAAARAVEQVLHPPSLPPFLGCREWMTFAAPSQVGLLTQWQRQDTQVLQELVRVVVEARERTGTAGKPLSGWSPRSPRF